MSTPTPPLKMLTLAQRRGMLPDSLQTASPQYLERICEFVFAVENGDVTDETFHEEAIGYNVEPQHVDEMFDMAHDVYARLIGRR